MGRRVNFRITAADRDLLVERLRQQGAVLLRWRLPTRELVPLQRLEDAGSRFAWAVRPEDFDKIVVICVNAQGYSTLDGLRSAALECDLSGTWKVREASGRFWYAAGHYDDDRNWVGQDPDFAAWADRQIAWVRRNFRRGHGIVYEGPGITADSERAWGALVIRTTSSATKRPLMPRSAVETIHSLVAVVRYERPIDQLVVVVDSGGNITVA